MPRTFPLFMCQSLIDLLRLLLVELATVLPPPPDTMKPTDRVNRIQDCQPTSATVLEVRWDRVLIEYEEGGQGWWPINCLQIIDNSDWPTFKGIALSHPALKEAILAAWPKEPQAAMALSATLLQAEQGATADFRGCWRAVCAAAPVAPKTVAELVALAERCQLPAEFVAALQPA